MKKGGFQSFCLCVALFISLLCACGKKTMPVPPQAVIPVAIADLAYELDDKGVTLTWSRPSQTLQGERLAAAPDYIIERGDSSAEDYCPGCPQKFNRQFKIADKAGRRFTDHELTAGNWYFYRIFTKAGWHLRSDPSNVVAFYKGAPLAAPARLELEAGDGLIRLKWQPSPGLVNGVYQLYRSIDGKSFVRRGPQIAGGKYTDKGLGNGKSYVYLLRAIDNKDASVAAGSASNIVSGTPHDLTPPPRPKNLRLVTMDTGLSLFWQPVAAADLAGYRVYRRLDGAFTLLAELGADQVSYLDKSAPGQSGWAYRVTAVDTAQPANESEPSQEVVYTKINF